MDRTKMRRSGKFGLICCPLGVFVGGMTWGIATGSGYWTYLIYASASAFLAPAFCWHVIVERRRTTVFRGALAGISGAVLGHFTTIIMNAIIIDLLIILNNRSLESSNGENILSLELQTLPLRVIFSMIVFGWLTLPMGGYIGASYAQRILKITDITSA